MSLMKQVSLLTAGCQPWNMDVCAADDTGERIAYCATLAVYVYEHERQSNEFTLTSIMAEHKRTITSISWNPHNRDIFATASTDCRLVVWNVAEQKIVAHLQNIKSPPCCIGWNPHETDGIAYIYGRGPLFIWNYCPAGGGTVSKHLESTSFYSVVSLFRWHPKTIGKLAFGHVDGSISVITPGQKPCKHYLRPESVIEVDEEDPVTCLEWDPLSVDYLLVSNVTNGIRLVDSEGMTVIMSFNLPSAATKVHSVAWIPSAPGMFLTGDEQVGVLRVWNVSKSTPVKTIKLKKTGFHAMKVIAPLQSNVSSSSKDQLTAISSTSAAREAPSSPNSDPAFLVPPANVFCTFLDGGVGVFDLGKKKWNFLKEMGHVETIFDCKFKPENPDLLATASFDGTVKVWDVNTMSAVHSSPGNEGIIYALSWAPGDLNCIVGATAKQGLFIWDITKGKVIKRFNEHGKSSVFNVSWNHKDSRRIASAGGDGTCVVRHVDGQLIKKYKHPASVYGCDWSLNNRDMLATGCEDKCVRVYYVAANTDQPLKIFSGHTAKVFHVKWCPLREGILCSGSDDRTVRIWNYTEEFCVKVLEGHTGPVRGLLWNPEIPFLLLSGSWDYTIKVWDTRDGRCLETVSDHGADVYGLSCHRHRPFTVASCSRDSTLRVWSLANIAAALQINIIAGQPFTEVVSTNLEQSLVEGATPVLVGRLSRELKGLVDKSDEKSRHLMAIKLFSGFFTPPFGASNLWDLVSVLSNSEDDILHETYSRGIMHTKHMVKYKASEAQELELVKLSKMGAALGAPTKDDRLREAANIHIKIGEVQRYCELMVELGEWDKALAVAPSVSMDYWESLTRRRAAQLVSEDSDAAIPYLVASGDIAKLVSFYTSRGQLHDSLLVAQVATEGGFPIIDKKGRDQNGLRRNDVLPKVKNHVAVEHSSLLQTTSTHLADWYFHKGQPVLAACCHLAVGNIKLALSKLVRGNELELAVSIGMSLHDSSSTFYLATELLAKKCERLNRWDLAIILLKSIPNPAAYLVKTCARCQGTNTEINELHQKANLNSLEECLEKAEELCEQEMFVPAMSWYLLSTSPELALDIGLNLARDVMSKQYWVLDEVLNIVELMSCVRTDRLQQNKTAKQRHELLALSSYIGALLAIRRQYIPVVHPLFKHARFLMHRDKVELGVSTGTVQAESEAWLVFSQPEDPPVAPTPEQKKVWDTLVKRTGTEKSEYGTGVDIVAGSHLPSHSEIHLSYLTKEKIKGPVFLLEDGKSVISLNDALMWAKVNVFSPLGTGVRINPF